MKLDKNALILLRERYLKKGEKPESLFKRVAKNISKDKKTEKRFYDMMSRLDFLPNSPTLFNAGKRSQQLTACFVLPIEDDIKKTLKNTAVIHRSGGGTGFDLSGTSDPVSILNIIDKATEQKKGANMGILRADHPDIKEFITAKENNKLTNFNISVAVTDNFMKDLKKNRIFNLICRMAWKKGDPGIIFIDTINKAQKLGKIKATSTCGEVPLLPYEACNLGSINLANLVKDQQIDFERLKQLVHDSVLFLDNVIDKSDYPLDEIKKITKHNRKIGLGVMGFADMLFQLEIPYDSEEALAVADIVMKFISEEAKKESIRLGKKSKKQKNATLTSIAPTGSISIIAGCSSGIEPVFALAYTRRFNKRQLSYINPYFEKTLKKRKLYSKTLIKKISQKGIQNIKEIPKDMKNVFVTALDISPEYHVRMQAVFQKYVDNSISKTVNLPKTATIKDIEKIFKQAHKLRCKGITVYRTGSHKDEILKIEKKCASCK